MTLPAMRYLRKLHLLFWTARYVTPAQIGHRTRRIIRQRWRQVIGREASQPAHWRVAAPHPLYIGLQDVRRDGPWAVDVRAALDRASAVAEQRFCFLNKCVDFGPHLGWHDPSLSRLWRYHLHYFDYVHDLLVWAGTGQVAAAYQTFRTLVDSWILGNQTLVGDGWHPYTLSLRLVNWLHAVQAFEPQLVDDDAFRQRLVGSLYGQAQVLSTDLEFDVRGNHLLKNLRALLWLGVAFEGPEAQRWFERALDLLQQELAEQVLSDGGHFERSPGYHALVLRDCLEIGLWLRRNRKTAPCWLDDTLRRMLDYLVAILPPDGRVPLLKDTAWDATPPPQDLLAAGALYFDEPAYKRSDDFGLYPLLVFGLAGWEKFAHWALNTSSRSALALPRSGYYVMRHDSHGEYLILDAGKPCPEYLPAHAHADLLSYELLIGGQRIVVDSGVYEYTAGPWRDYFRATRAHNTVQVMEKSQSEVWSSFRVARRAQPGRVVWRPEDDHILIQGEHNGYHRLRVPVTHRRTVVWRKNRFWLVVDELWGKGHTRATNHVHLHHALALEAVDDSMWRVQGCHSPLWITAFGQQSHSIVRGQMEPWRQGWFSERFGQLLPNAVLTLHQQGPLPFCYGYVISLGEPVEAQCADATDSLSPELESARERCHPEGHQVAVRYGQRSYTLRLPRVSAPDFQ